MESKRELSDKINALLGLDPPIEFHKLKKEELERLFEIFSRLPNLVQVGARATVERVMDGPVVKATRDILNMPIMKRWKQIRESGGVLGMFERQVQKRTGDKSDENKKSSEAT